MTVMRTSLGTGFLLIFGPVCREIFSVTELQCVVRGLQRSAKQAVAPMDAQQVFIKMPRRPITANGEGYYIK